MDALPISPLASLISNPFWTAGDPDKVKITTPRDEKTRVEILSGVFEGLTFGLPCHARQEQGRPTHKPMIEDENQISSSRMPTTLTKRNTGISNHEGGGSSSARETIARVAAGAIAQKILSFDGVSIPPSSKNS